MAFTVGKSKDSDWPFIHPIANCPWAEVEREAKIYSIEFDSPKAHKDFFLKIGFADSSTTGITIEVRLNGKKIGAQNGFFYDKDVSGRHTAPASLYAHPDGVGVPSKPFTIRIPFALFKSDGTKNQIELVPVFNKKSGVV